MSNAVFWFDANIFWYENRMHEIVENVGVDC